MASKSSWIEPLGRVTGFLTSWSIHAAMLATGSANLSGFPSSLPPDRQIPSSREPARVTDLARALDGHGRSLDIGAHLAYDGKNKKGASVCLAGRRHHEAVTWQRSAPPR